MSPPQEAAQPKPVKSWSTCLGLQLRGGSVQNAPMGPSLIGGGSKGFPGQGRNRWQAWSCHGASHISESNDKHGGVRVFEGGVQIFGDDFLVVEIVGSVKGAIVVMGHSLGKVFRGPLSYGEPLVKWLRAAPPVPLTRPGLPTARKTPLEMKRLTGPANPIRSPRLRRRQ